MSKKAIVILVILIIIVGGGIAYYSLRGGPTQNPRQYGGNFGGPNASSTGRMMRTLPAGSVAIFGTIGTVTGDTFTITDRSGAVQTVTVNAGTQFTGGTQTDLKAGTRVGGVGSTTPDGGITATQIRLGMMGGGRRSGGTSPGGAPTQGQ